MDFRNIAKQKAVGTILQPHVLNNFIVNNTFDSILVFFVKISYVYGKFSLWHLAIG